MAEFDGKVGGIQHKAFSAAIKQETVLERELAWYKNYSLYGGIKTPTDLPVRPSGLQEDVYEALQTVEELWDQQQRGGGWVDKNNLSWCILNPDQFKTVATSQQGATKWLIDDSTNISPASHFYLTTTYHSPPESYTIDHQLYYIHLMEQVVEISDWSIDTYSSDWRASAIYQYTCSPVNQNAQIPSFVVYYIPKFDCWRANGDVGEIEKSFDNVILLRPALNSDDGFDSTELFIESYIDPRNVQVVKIAEPLQITTAEDTATVTYEINFLH